MGISPDTLKVDIAGIVFSIIFFSPSLMVQQKLATRLNGFLWYLFANWVCIVYYNILKTHSCFHFDGIAKYAQVLLVPTVNQL